MAWIFQVEVSGIELRKVKSEVFSLITFDFPKSSFFLILIAYTLNIFWYLLQVDFDVVESILWNLRSIPQRWIYWPVARFSYAIRFFGKVPFISVLLLWDGIIVIIILHFEVTPKSIEFLFYTSDSFSPFAFWSRIL